jgi:hypothetical protein
MEAKTGYTDQLTQTGHYFQIFNHLFLGDFPEGKAYE